MLHFRSGSTSKNSILCVSPAIIGDDLSEEDELFTILFIPLLDEFQSPVDAIATFVIQDDGDSKRFVTILIMCYNIEEDAGGKQRAKKIYTYYIV